MGVGCGSGRIGVGAADAGGGVAAGEVVFTSY